MTVQGRIFAPVLIALVCFSGCAKYKPKAYVPASSFRKQYLQDVTAPNLLQTYNNMPQSSAAEIQAKVTRRNRILQQLIALIDANYSDFESQYYGSDATISFAGDLANLGLTGVSSVTGTAHLKSVLSAIATGTTGIKTSYLKNFYDQQTRAAVVQKMRASRATQLGIIQDQDHMKAPVVCPATGCPQVDGKAVSPYSLETGLSDVAAYYDAGTIIKALQDIASTSGDEQKRAQVQQKTNGQTPQLF